MAFAYVVSIDNTHENLDVPACFAQLAELEVDILEGRASPNSLIPLIREVFEYNSFDNEDPFPIGDETLMGIAHMHFLTLRHLNNKPLHSDGIMFDVVTDTPLYEDTLREYGKFLECIRTFVSDSQLEMSELKEVQLSFGFVDGQGKIAEGTGITLDMAKRAIAAYTERFGNSFFKSESNTRKQERRGWPLMLEVSVILLLLILVANSGNDSGSDKPVAGGTTKTPTPVTESSQFVITPTANPSLDDSAFLSPAAPSGPSPEPLTRESLNAMTDEDILQLSPGESVNKSVSSIKRNIVITLNDSGYTLFDVLQQREVDHNEAGVILLNNIEGDHVEFPFNSGVDEMAQSMDRNGINGSVAKDAQVNPEGKDIFQKLLASLVGVKGQDKYVFTYESTDDFQVISDFACWGIDIGGGEIYSVVVYIDANGNYRIEVVGINPEVINEQY